MFAGNMNGGGIMLLGKKQWVLIIRLIYIKLILNFIFLPTMVNWGYE